MRLVIIGGRGRMRMRMRCGRGRMRWLYRREKDEMLDAGGEG